MVLSGYNKCLSIPISSSEDGELTDYQIKLTLIKGSGTNSSSTIYLDNENLNWPNDVRFSTNQSGLNLLDFWREEYDATDGTWWVKIPTLPASGGITIYLHVGNADATDASDSDETFSFADADFLDFTISDVTVSADSGKYEAWPGIAKDSDGNLYVVYRTSDTNVHGYESTGRVVLRKSTDDGATWGSEVVVSNETDIDDRNPNILIFDDDGTETILVNYNAYDGTNSIAYCRKATVASLSFGSQIALSSTNNRACRGAPILLSNGKILIPIYYYGITTTFVVESSDGGDTWTEYTITSSYGSECSIIETKTSGSYSGGVCALIRDETSPYTYKKVLSTDYGHTWGSPSDESDLASAYKTPASLYRDSDGDIIVIYTTSDGFLTMYKSADECSNFSKMFDLPVGQSSGSYYPQMVENDDGDQIIVVWCTNKKSPDSSDVYVSILPWPFKWTVTGVPVTSVSSGILSFEQYGGGENISSNDTFGYNTIIRARMKIVALDSTHARAAIGFNPFTYPDDPEYAQVVFYSITSPYGRTNIRSNDGEGDVTGSKIETINDTSNYHIVEIGRTSTAVWWSHDDVLIESLSSGIPSSSLPVTIGQSYYPTSGQYFKSLFDWVVVRKYAVDEPEISTAEWVVRSAGSSIFWI